MLSMIYLFYFFVLLDHVYRKGTFFIQGWIFYIENIILFYIENIILDFYLNNTTQKCLYLEFFSSLFSCTWTESEDLQSKSLYSVQMWENADQKMSKYWHFLGRASEILLSQRK